MREKRQWILGMFFVLGWGCGGGVAFEDPWLSSSELWCSQNSDCGGENSAYICQDSVCRLGCTDDGHCGNGYICDADFCQPGCRVEHNEKTCDGGYACVGKDSQTPGTPGTCQPTNNCEENDCPPFYVCVNNVCSLGCKNGSTCHTAGYVCVGATEDRLGTCQPGCYTTDNCNKNTHVCVGATEGNLGVCKLACEMDKINSCQDGYVCVKAASDSNLGTCQLGCNDDDQCHDGKGYVCQEPAAGAPKICQPGCRPNDEGDTDACGEGYICKGGDSSRNEPGECKPGCRVGNLDNTCGNSYLCVRNVADNPEGTCKAGCRPLEGCSDGQTCEGHSNANEDLPEQLGTCFDADCTVGGTTCAGEDKICIGIRNQTPNAAGICRDICIFNNNGIGLSHACPSPTTHTCRRLYSNQRVGICLQNG